MINSTFTTTMDLIINLYKTFIIDFYYKINVTTK